MGTNDIIIKTTGNGAHLATDTVNDASNVATGDVSTGGVTINGLDGNTITSTTLVGLSET
jgi:hypothetical protein